MQTYNQFSGQMLRVGGAAAITEKYQLTSRCESFGRTYCKHLDSGEQLIGETLFYAAAFTELLANVFNVRAHGILDEDDFIAVTGYTARGVSRIDHQLGGFHDHGIIVARVIGGDQRAVV